MNQEQASTSFEASSTHIHLPEKDMANMVLSELKRISREYATAALEANDSNIRQVFTSLLFRTLQDQTELYAVLSENEAYRAGLVMASEQDVQNELQNQGQSANALRWFVEKHLQSAEITRSTVLPAYVGQSQGVQNPNQEFQHAQNPGAPYTGYRQGMADQRASLRTFESYDQTYRDDQPGQGEQRGYARQHGQGYAQEGQQRRDSQPFTPQGIASHYGFQPQTNQPGQGRQLGDYFGGTKHAARLASTASGSPSAEAAQSGGEEAGLKGKEGSNQFGSYIL